jgi:hypothetical protein
MSVAGTDEATASELEQHVDTAMRRGAVTVAAEALERGASLTADPKLKGRCLVSAAELAYELGLSDVVSRLIEQAKPLELTSSDEARLSWLREMTSGNVWYEPGAAKTFVTIARQIADVGGNADAALRSLVPVAHRSWWTRPRATTRRYLVEAAQSLGSRKAIRAYWWSWHWRIRRRPVPRFWTSPRACACATRPIRSMRCTSESQPKRPEHLPWVRASWRAPSKGCANR